ncbi:MAG: ABC transporter ATP-binding protein [Planctomycetes bacterium]|nr:ABC transporter ATP-binding protein [Planctomycetota bacterium]
MTLAIRLRDVSKSFRLRHRSPFLARELLRAVMQRPTRVEVFWALRHVSFEIRAGEAVGVIGHNGAGKSTLLSLVARTARPTEGELEVNGRVAAMLELGAGFHPDLTGYENIFLNGMLLGLSRREVAARLESIAAYADLGEFLDTPIHTYSTGMRARLGFAVVAHVDPDIIILDEVLGVGDAAFQDKCRATLTRFRAAGTTMFLVSHQPSNVRALCERVLWLDQGRLVADGPTEDVLARYREASQQLATRTAAARPAAGQSGTTPGS